MADRKISDLTALTTPASGDYLPIVDISEASAANKNKRITIEELLRGAPDGTAGAPGIGFESDPNTGIYSPGADALGLVTAGTERLRITSAGFVGIGTSGPGALFHTVNTSAGAATLGAVIQNASSTANTEVRLGFSPNISVVSDDRYAYIGAINVLGSTDNSLTFGTGLGSPATERMRIDSSGRVGIGTTSPSSLLHLADAGDITVGTTTGTKIGTATTQKLGFYNATPVVQPAAVADATDAATVITQLNDLLAKLRTLGIIAT